MAKQTHSGKGSNTNLLKSSATINNHHEGISENMLMKMLESQEETIKWLKHKLDEKDIAISLLRETLIEKEKQIERFEQKSGENIIMLFNKLDEIHETCELVRNAQLYGNKSLEEHKSKTWKDLESIKRQHIKKKKMNIVA